MARFVFRAILTAVVIGCASARDSSPFDFCRDSKCQDCPVTPAASAGFPQCATFNTDDVFSGGNFTIGAHTGYSVYVNVPAPQTGCATILRQIFGGAKTKCGAVIGIWKHPACTRVELTSNTFMTQFCCGLEDCQRVGVLEL